MRTFLISLALFLISQGTTQQGIVNIPKPSGGGSPTTCGNTGALSGGEDNGNSGFALGANLCTPASNATVQSCVVDTQDATGNMACAIYALSGGTPTGSAICSGHNTAASVTTITLTGCGTLTASTVYGLLVEPDNNTVGIALTTATFGTSGFFQGSVTYPTFPTGGSWTSYATANSYSVFLNVTE